MKNWVLRCVDRILDSERLAVFIAVAGFVIFIFGLLGPEIFLKCARVSPPP